MKGRNIHAGTTALRFCRKQIRPIGRNYRSHCKSGIDIRALTIADTRDFGILRLIVDKPAQAEAVLKDAGMTVSITSVIMMGISDRPGEFAKAMRILADSKISVEYMYAFVSKDSGKASIIIRTDEVERGIEILQSNGVSILTQEDIG